MRLIPNVTSLVFGGLWLALGHLINCVVLIVAIPFGSVSLLISSCAPRPFTATVPVFEAHEDSAGLPR